MFRLAMVLACVLLTSCASTEYKAAGTSPTLHAALLADFGLSVDDIVFKGPIQVQVATKAQTHAYSVHAVFLETPKKIEIVTYDQAARSFRSERSISHGEITGIALKRFGLSRELQMETPRGYVLLTFLKAGGEMLDTKSTELVYDRLVSMKIPVLPKPIKMGTISRNDTLIISVPF